MINFEQARKLAYEGLSKTNTIEKIKTLSNNQKDGYLPKELWKIAVDVEIDGSVQEFTLLMDITKDFPLTLPKLYLSEIDYEAIKYVPHIDTSRYICLFDQENIKIAIDRPADVAKLCLRKAIEIIKNGITTSNSRDFQDEIVAYWENKYGVKDEVRTGFVGAYNEKIEVGELDAFSVSPAYTGVNFIFGKGTEFEKTIQFFKLRGHKIEKISAFYLGNAQNLKPPFYFSSGKLLYFLENHFKSSWSKIINYLNKDPDYKVLIFSVRFDSQVLYFGFFIPSVKREIKGWRLKSLSAVTVMATLRKHSPVTRLVFKEFSKARFTERTDGLFNAEGQFKILIAGLGSIGSNLASHLSILDMEEVILVDPDILSIENVNRHLLGFNEVGDYKVNGVANFLQSNFPFLNITRFAGSIIDFLNKNLSIINELDILFFAIGKDATDRYILDLAGSGVINKPIVLLWVEPYLLGAHALYISSGTQFSFDLLEEDGFYKYNVISADAYSDPTVRLMLREAGCQGSYVPFGREAIARFFYLLLPRLLDVIKNKSNKNIGWSYSGNLDISFRNEIKLSRFGLTLSSYQITEHTLQ
jgi:hypothetical protein